MVPKPDSVQADDLTFIMLNLPTLLLLWCRTSSSAMALEIES
ncbi:hypothetical protein F443_14265 [Phytophthora nicotianae P1569]|uniref:Uncharacterized protein n=2 Tax=Phytophthora nicotianae TaxID=4792 RepID=V9EN21_PHYNI|nr:hypothetical protein F443_14265 [Phytophthora nicotianae P1569]ETO69032.1 hypothetical protein F444_14281 [Phytophthora nicotianae P1976]